MLPLDLIGTSKAEKSRYDKPKKKRLAMYLKTVSTLQTVSSGKTYNIFWVIIVGTSTLLNLRNNILTLAVIQFLFSLQVVKGIKVS